MDALSSAVDRPHDAFGWTEAVGGEGSPPPVKRGCLPDPEALRVSRTVSGYGPNPRSPLPSTLSGADAPVCLAPEVHPSWFSSFWDDTLVSCPSFGDGALGGVSLLRASELNESSDEDCLARDLAGLQKVWHQLIYLCLGNPGSIDVFGFCALTSFPGAGPWDPTPGCCR